MTRTMLTAACVAVLPAVAVAEDETRLPEDAWRTEFVGQYAEEGACDDSDAIWTLTEVAVDMGRISCVGLGKMTWENDALVVPLSECTAGGEPHPDMRIGFRAAEEGVAVVGDTHDVTLLPCD